MVLAATASALPACSSYYHVTEPTSGRQYLTTSVDESARRATGAAVFSDAVSGAEVSLANSEIVKIGEVEYRELLRAMQQEREESYTATNGGSDGGSDGP